MLVIEERKENITPSLQQKIVFSIDLVPRNGQFRTDLESRVIREAMAFLFSNAKSVL